MWSFAARLTSAPTVTPAGQWQIVNSPNPGTLYNYLIKVTCVSANDCWAVGSHYAGNHDQALILHYDGTSWSVVPSPSPEPASSSFLADIKCLSTNNCWAVGSYSAASTGTIGFGNVPVGNQPLVEHWDGTAWTVTASPPAPADSQLRGVSCVSATNCWAVGSFGDGVIQTFVEHYDGVAWTIVPSPNQSSPTNRLYAVACNNSADCWAVGEFFNTVPATCGENQTVSTENLVLHYDGVAWSVVNAPYDGCRYSLLDKITCNSSNDCWAVGTQGTTSGIFLTLVQHFDGTAWSIVPSPNTDPNLLNYLYGVTCASPNDCWATGTHDLGGTNYRPMIHHYDGAAWSIADGPVLNTSYRLDDVTCINSNDCWAVGINNNGKTLIEHYTVPLRPSAVVSRMNHGSAGTFDVDLTNGDGIECRNDSSLSKRYQVVFTFINPLISVGGLDARGDVSGGSANIDAADPRKCTVDLLGVENAQRVTITLNDVTDSLGNFTASVPASMGVLIGDTNGDGVVNSADIAQTKSQSGIGLTNSNFREDLTTDGNLNSADIGLVKSKSGTGLP